MMANRFRYKIKNYAVIILAAGKSSRLGRPKQLLAYQDKTLLEHSIDSAKAINPEQLIVVLGSNKELIASTLDSKGILVTENQNWQSGIASSIKAGINVLKLTSSRIEAVILMVCDQPFADGKLLKQLILTQAESGSPLVGCAYEGTMGTPALFHASFYPELFSLEGDSGAKKLLEKYGSVASFVSFSKGGVDIDTFEDYRNLPK